MQYIYSIDTLQSVSFFLPLKIKTISKHRPSSETVLYTCHLFFQYEKKKKKDLIFQKKKKIDILIFVYHFMYPVNIR
jgi:hypothetical protein